MTASKSEMGRGTTDARSSFARRRVGAMTAFAIAAVLAMVLGACGGGSDSGGDTSAAASDSAGQTAGAGSDAGNSSDAGDTDSAPVAADGPITGAVRSEPTIGLGLFTWDRTTGAQRELSTADDIEFVDRNRQPVLGAEAAFTVGLTTREGQSFAHDVSLVRIDFATGAVTSLADLGFDRETDDSNDSIDYEIVAADAAQVIVQQRSSGGDDTTHRRFDPNTGAELGSFGKLLYEVTTDDGGSCSADVRDITFLPDGNLVGLAGTDPVLVDPETGEVTSLVDCFALSPSLADFVDAADFASFVLVRDGDVFGAEQVDRTLSGARLDPSRGFVAGDGDLWWVASGAYSIDDQLALYGAVVRFDIETASIVDVFPLGDYAGVFTEPEPGSSCCTSSPLTVELGYADGRLVMVDITENGPVLILDPATGNITELVLEPGDGVDFTTAEFLATDPAALWITVDRMTIVSEDDSGRSSSGPRYIERIDPATATVIVSVVPDDGF